MCALPPKADIEPRRRNVCFVPKADMAPHQEAESICRRALALIVPSLAAGACSFRPGVKLIWLAETAISAERCAALFDSEEPTVSPARSSVGSAPFIGVGGGRTDDEE